MKNKMIKILLIILFLVSSYASAMNIYSSGDIVDQSQTNRNLKILFSPPQQYAQSFIPTISKLSKVELYLNISGNPTVTGIVVSIKKFLSGDNLTVVEKSVNEISTSWIEFDFEDLYLNSGETYYIVCNPLGNWSESKNLISWYGFYPDSYPSGSAWYINPGEKWQEIFWEAQPTDFCFKTYSFENTPPRKPIITGESNGKAGTEYNYSFVSTDPDVDEISYFIDWGDNTSTGWTSILPSGEVFNSSHNWSKRGYYVIKAKAKDTYGAECDWETFEISMLKIKTINTPLFLQRLFHRFSIFQKILKQIIL